MVVKVEGIMLDISSLGFVAVITIVEQERFSVVMVVVVMTLVVKVRKGDTAISIKLYVILYLILSFYPSFISFIIMYVLNVSLSSN